MLVPRDVQKMFEDEERKKEMKKLGMFIINFPAFTFLIINWTLAKGFRTYFIEIWSDTTALTVPFWKWTDWRSVLHQWTGKKSL